MNLMYLIWAIFKNLILECDLLYLFVSCCTLITMLMMMFFYISNCSPEVNLPSNGMKINDASDQVSELWRITSNNATYLIILVPFHKSSYSFKIFSDSARASKFSWLSIYIRFVSAYDLTWRSIGASFYIPIPNLATFSWENSMIARQASHTIQSQSYVISRRLYLALCSAWYRQQHDFAISEE